MSRSNKDQKGGHPFPGYDKENQVVKDMTRRKRRHANKKHAERWDDERTEPNPEKSSQGWNTW